MGGRKQFCEAYGDSCNVPTLPVTLHVLLHVYMYVGLLWVVLALRLFHVFVYSWGQMNVWGELASRKRLSIPVLKAGHPCVLKCFIISVQVDVRAHS